MAINTELQGPGFFIFFREEDHASLGRAGQRGKQKEQEILDDDKEFFRLVQESITELFKYLRR